LRLGLICGLVQLTVPNIISFPTNRTRGLAEYFGNGKYVFRFSALEDLKVRVKIIRINGDRRQRALYDSTWSITDLRVFNVEFLAWLDTNAPASADSVPVPAPVVNQGAEAKPMDIDVEGGPAIGAPSDNKAARAEDPDIKAVVIDDAPIKETDSKIASMGTGSAVGEAKSGGELPVIDRDSKTVGCDAKVESVPQQSPAVDARRVRDRVNVTTGGSRATSRPAKSATSSRRANTASTFSFASVPVPDTTVSVVAMGPSQINAPGVISMEFFDKAMKLYSMGDVQGIELLRAKIASSNQHHIIQSQALERTSATLTLTAQTVSCDDGNRL
jgi:hypothetical protein